MGKWSNIHKTILFFFCFSTETLTWLTLADTHAGHACATREGKINKKKKIKFQDGDRKREETNGKCWE
jgi:hypothetical protein